MKSEKEKMLSGLSYFGPDKELMKDRQLAKELFFEFNSLNTHEASIGRDIIQKLFGKTGKEFIIESPFRCDYGYNISIGEKFYSNFNLTILDGAKVTIGNNVFIGPNVSLYTINHPLDVISRNKEIEIALPIVIGDNVWIGGNVVINPGVEIGSNTVIGSGSVVVKNIPNNSLAVGNPCVEIKELVNNEY